MLHEKVEKFISIREACSITGLTAQSLRKMADAQQIKSYKTPGGQRRFDKSNLEEMCYSLSINEKVPDIPKQNFIYTRVSSKKQMDDLARQVKYITSRRPEYASYISISDVASGINFKRRGLSTILDSCLQGTINELVVAHRDRLCRFGFELIENIVKKAGGKIIVLDDSGNKSTEQELAEDLLSIIHIYSCRQMGKRKYKTTNKVLENEAEINKESENDN